MKWAKIGNIAGKHGEKGEDAKVDPAEIARLVVPLVPVPRDGKDADPVAIDQLKEQFLSLQATEVETRSHLIATNDNLLKQAAEVGELREKINAFPVPRDGRDADPEFVKALIAGAIAEYPGPADPVEVDPEKVRVEVERQIALLPPAKDGAAGKDADPIDYERLAALVPVKEGPPGRDADPAVIAAEVERAVALIPRPVDGKNVDLEAVAAMVQAEVERAVAEIPPPRDGENGDDGQPGKDGRDGFQLEQLGVALKDDNRTFVFSMRGGNREEVHEVKIPIPLDAGVYQSGKAYEKGDCVTYAGSLWIAQKDTSESPGNGTDFRLSVKRGKDAA